VIHELERAADRGVDETEVSRLQAVLSEVSEREKRLVHLFTLGDINEEAVRNESVNLAGEKRVIEERLTSLNTARTPRLGRLNQMRLEHICKGIADWLDRAGESERELALVVLQVTVKGYQGRGHSERGAPN
jgi:hypothetical protein